MQVMQVSRPTKEAVRHYMQQRQVERKPPPSQEEIRRQMGWGMLPNNDSLAVSR